jgi:hypothetical protein
VTISFAKNLLKRRRENKCGATEEENGKKEFLQGTGEKEISD